MSHNPLIFSGTANPQLAEEIAKRLKLHVGKALVSEFKNQETRVEIGENVRGSEVFVVQSICKSPAGNGVNDVPYAATRPGENSHEPPAAHF